MRATIAAVAVTAISVITHASVPTNAATELWRARSIQPAPANISGGYAVASDEGERLVYCGRPLALNIKVDAKKAPGTRLIAGTAELRGDEGAATHREGDEVVYVIRGSGHVVRGNTRVSLEAGSVAFVPQGTSHRIISVGPAPLEYMWVLGPRSSADSFRQAATLGCDGRASAPVGPSSPAPPMPPNVAGQDAADHGAFVVPPGEGERLRYCELPLVLTLKVESETIPVARLRAATGVLSKGEERGVHRDADEVLYVVGGRGRALIGDQTTALQAGSVMFVPQDTPHGLINTDDEPLEYFVVHSPQASAAGFRRRAAVPGPHCAGHFR